MPKKVALYARVSTDEQSVEAQLHQLKEAAARAGAEVVEYVDEGQSGRKRGRPGLDAMLKAARQRQLDAVWVVRLDRLARSLAHMAALGEELQALDVELVSLTEGIDTSTPTGRAMFGMCGVFAQLEGDLIRERTKQGVAAARRAGKRLGRPPALDPEQVQRIARMRRAGRSWRHIAGVIGCSYGTARRALSALE